MRQTHILYWPGGSKQVRTRAIASRKMRAWSKWKQRQGWTVHGSRAIGPNGEREAIVLHSFTPAGERIMPKLPPILTEEQVREKYLKKKEPTVKRPRRKKLAAV